MTAIDAGKRMTELEVKLMEQCIKDWFVAEGMDVGDVMFVPVHRHRGAWGYCYKDNNWQSQKGTSREIALTPDAIVAGCEQMCNTMLHELVHAYNATNGISDVNGTIHNNRFKKACDKIGLTCVRLENDRRGWSTDLERREESCRVKEALTITRAWNKDDILFMHNIKTVLPRSMGGTGGITIGVGGTGGTGGIEIVKPKDRNLKVFVCPECGAKARASPSTELLCGKCTSFLNPVWMRRKD